MTNCVTRAALWFQAVDHIHPTIQGYDVFYLASALKLNSLGLDISETAIEKANSILNTLDLPPNTGKASFSSDNFFYLQVEEQFDLIYDYTFFVAIPPSKRREWGDKMASLIKAGGYLITLVFPIDPPTDLGPPFFVRVEHYDEVLVGSFEKVLDKIPTSSLPTHLGRESIAVWRRI
ncbi:hypothetical protein H0H93_013879 [Arthromyces matolae]|nr:hypothetical protein H0H93_013879 [Arthromyces matolae]